MLRLIVKMTHMFCSGLVMGLADCINLAGLAKILEKPVERKLGPLPDTLQAGTCVFPPFQNVHVIHTYHPPSSYLRANMGCALAIPFQVRSLNVPTKDRSPLTVPFLGVPSL